MLPAAWPGPHEAQFVTSNFSQMFLVAPAKSVGLALGSMIYILTNVPIPILQLSCGTSGLPNTSTRLNAKVSGRLVYDLALNFVTNSSRDNGHQVIPI